MNWTEQEYNEYLLKRKSPSKAKVVSKPVKQTSEYDSYAERVYYEDYIYPLILTGEIIKVETHRKFEILSEMTISGITLKAKRYTPDFILYYSGGTVKVVEIKGKIVKKLQRDYQLRKHLFLEKHCGPNGWLFEEVSSEKLTKEQ